MGGQSRQFIKTEFGFWITNTSKRKKRDVMQRIDYDVKAGPPKPTQAHNQSDLDNRNIIGLYARTA